jgi:Predicted enzyme related to lactoylglutathione lyase
MAGIGIKEMAFVGYAVNDIAETCRFYTEILGLPEGTVFEHEGEVGWVEFTTPDGQTIAITKASEQWQPNANGGGVCLEVEDLDVAVATVEKAGVKLVMPIQDYPICRLALIFDPSGNTIALHQKKSNHPECSH